MKNLYVYLLVRWKIKSRGNVYFETRPDRLYIEINQTDIKEREATECLYILSKLLYSKKKGGSQLAPPMVSCQHGQ